MRSRNVDMTSHIYMQMSFVVLVIVYVLAYHYIKQRPSLPSDGFDTARNSLSYPVLCVLTMVFIYSTVKNNIHIIR